MDDERLRRILRSVLVVATAGPAGAAFACGAVAATGNVADGGAGNVGVTIADGAADVVADTATASDASVPDAMPFLPSDPCMTYGHLPEDGGFGRNTMYEAGVCNAYCVPPPGVGRAASACWALEDPMVGPFLGCAYPIGDRSMCGCADVQQPGSPFTSSTDEPLPCRGVLDASTAESCSHLCPKQSTKLESCEVHVGTSTSNAYLRCTYDYVLIGRRAAGVIEPAPARGTAIGAFLADACHREAASVAAFVRLREELLAHGAPRDLVERADRAREDEVRHAVIMEKLARRYGAEDGEWAREPRYGEVEERSLEEIAVENAVEGCVYETWSALLNFWQAEHATDRVLRRALAAIAEDELRHASLAWAVHAWLCGVLDAPARARVEAAERAAIAAFTVPANELAIEVRELAGVPDCASSRRLVAGLDAMLWSGSASA
jgi:hypothetical protein